MKEAQGLVIDGPFEDEPQVDAALIAVAKGFSEFELRSNPELAEWSRNILKYGPTPSVREPEVATPAKLFLVK